MDANDAPNGRKGVSIPNSNNMSLPPVALYSAGKGLPYAPVWPNAGQAMGPRVSPYDSGEGMSRKKVKDASRTPRTFPTRVGKAAGGGGNEEHVTRKPTRKSSRPMARSSTAMHMDDIVDLSSDSDEANFGDPTAMDSANSQSDRTHASSSAAYDSIALSVTREKLQAEAIPETFDDYVNSLDDILTQPPRGVGSAPAAGLMSEARTRLSEILGMDLRTLLSSKDLVTEIQTLSSALQRGSNLNTREHSILRLIDEIPTSVKDFEKAEKVKTDAEKFFVNLAVNVALATNLGSLYNESKNNAALLQTKFNTESAVIEVVDNELCYLLGRRDQASYAIEKNKRELAELTSKQ